MPDYRIYLVKNDHIAQGYDFYFETDDQARAQAQSMLGTYSKAEVWIGTTRVGVEDLKTLPSSAEVSVDRGMALSNQTGRSDPFQPRLHI